VKIYLVGGAVRDSLLGLSGSDRDWVVVGATPEQMVAQGYVPVGKDFPVFLHPVTKEEYALARTERKTAPGYKGFVVHAAPDVTLEQDLARRDLTINAMAQDCDDPARPITDPYGGQQDLRDKVLRHVTDAFREDPVRILRLARFAARFGDFIVAPETLMLAQQMVQAGEVDALVPERVWQEVERGLLSPHPLRMAQVLMDCGAWQRLWPELDASLEIHHAALWRLDELARESGTPARGTNDMTVEFSTLTLGQRWALWCHGASPEQVAAIGERFRVPTAVQDLAWSWATHRHALAERPADAATACELLYRMDALRRPERGQDLIDLARQSARDTDQTKSALWWSSALRALLSVDAKAVNQSALAQGLRGPDVGLALKQAHVAAIAREITKLGSDPN
jgi:tRNA nucleotidyltransferase (CCA-adding enzyme)